MSSTVQVPGGFVAVVVLLPKSEDAVRRRDDGRVPTVTLHGVGDGEDEFPYVAQAIHELVEDQVMLVEHLLDSGEEQQGGGQSPVEGLVSGQGAVAAALGVEVDETLAGGGGEAEDGDGAKPAAEEESP